MLVASHFFKVAKPSEGLRKVKQMKSLFDFNPKKHSIQIEWSGKVSNGEYGVLSFPYWYNIEPVKDSIIWDGMVFDTIYELRISVTIFER